MGMRDYSYSQDISDKSDLGFLKKYGMPDLRSGLRLDIAGMLRFKHSQDAGGLIDPVIHPTHVTFEGPSHPALT